MSEKTIMDVSSWQGSTNTLTLRSIKREIAAGRDRLWPYSQRCGRCDDRGQERQRGGCSLPVRGLQVHGGQAPHPRQAHPHCRPLGGVLHCEIGGR